MEWVHRSEMFARPREHIQRWHPLPDPTNWESGPYRKPPANVLEFARFDVPYFFTLYFTRRCTHRNRISITFTVLEKKEKKRRETFTLKQVLTLLVSTLVYYKNSVHIKLYYYILVTTHYTSFNIQISLLFFSILDRFLRQQHSYWQ